MKRTELKRRTPLGQNSPSEAPLRRSEPLRRLVRPDGQATAPKPQKGSYGRPKARRWYEQKAKQCALCPSRSNLKLHHVCYEQHVDREGGDISDPRNSLTLCVRCHDSHHGLGRIDLSKLRDENYAFAAELFGADAAYEYLRRRYVGVDQRLDRLLLAEHY